MQKCQAKLCRKKQHQDEHKPYHWFVNQDNPGFPGNYISTTRYTVLTFLPLNLLEQFRRLSNVYFLLSVIVSLFPGVSPISPATTILPLMFVLTVGALKDGIEDLARWRADKRANNHMHKVVKGGKLQDTPSQRIRVGDIIMITKDEPFPADLIFLSAPLLEGQHDVECYIETANLDGETTLKPKRAIDATAHLNTVEAIMQTEIEVVADPPHRSLVQWEGMMKISGKETPLTLKQFLFRGCMLRNTEWILGALCYAGKDTKMMRNLKARPSKRSIMEKKLNNFITFTFPFNVCLCLLLSLLAMIFKNEYTRYAWYLKFFDGTDASVFLSTYLSYFLLLSYMIPISLFVTIEVCKAFSNPSAF